MEDVEKLYHIVSLLLGVLAFFMTITIDGNNAIMSFIAKAVFKIASLFVIGYAMIQLFSILGVV